MNDLSRDDLLNLRSKHFNLMHTLKRCNHDDEKCSFVGKLIDTVKYQFDLIEKLSKDINFDFPINHYSEHRELISKLKKHEDEYKNNIISLTDFINITSNFYSLHYIAFGELLYDDMLRHCDITDIAV